jgi:hypothetical protein
MCKKQARLDLMLPDRFISIKDFDVSDLCDEFLRFRLLGNINHRVDFFEVALDFGVQLLDCFFGPGLGEVHVEVVMGIGIGGVVNVDHFPAFYPSSSKLLGEDLAHVSRPSN